MAGSQQRVHVAPGGSIPTCAFSSQLVGTPCRTKRYLRIGSSAIKLQLCRKCHKYRCTGRPQLLIPPLFVDNTVYDCEGYSSLLSPAMRTVARAATRQATQHTTASSILFGAHTCRVRLSLAGCWTKNPALPFISIAIPPLPPYSQQAKREMREERCNEKILSPRSFTLYRTRHKGQRSYPVVCDH